MKTAITSTVLPIAALIVLASTLFIAEPTNANNADTPKAPLVTHSATGFYGIDDNGNPIPDRSGIMLVFDAAISPLTVTTQTFIVTLDDGESAKVLETSANKTLVFLKLENLLSSNATPTISSVRQNFQSFELNDGIFPTLAMTLSGGSGTGTGDEGPDRLTKDKIDITVTSDEPLAEPPNITVVCNDLQWTETADSTLIRNDIDNFIANRAGQLTATNAESPDGTYPDYSCGSDDNLTLTTSSMTTINETSWSYEWRNQTETPSKLSDGLLTAVAHAPDRSEYQRYTDGSTVHNWNSATANFTLDTILKSPLEDGGGAVYLTEGRAVHNGECFSIPGFQFSEKTRVTINSVVTDPPEAVWFFKHEEYSGESNRWNLHSNPYAVEWPPKTFEAGEYNVSVAASDAADNFVEFDFLFDILALDEINHQREPFVIALVPGWNAISLPAPPINDDFEKVFDNDSVGIVFQWLGNYGFSAYESNWDAAIRDGDQWQPIPPFPLINNIGRISTPLGGDGFWVYSHDYVNLSVRLRWPTSLPWCIEVIPDVSVSELLGWNFVGVYDDDRHHVHEVTFGDSSGQSLHPDLGVAFRWNATDQRYTVIEPGGPLTVGEAIWVYFPDWEP